MQIIPTSKSSVLGDELFAQMGQGTSASEAFKEYMEAQMEALHQVSSGEESSVQNALASNPDVASPLAEAPYSKHTTNGVTYSMDEVCFTKQELGELRQDLVNAGAPEESLQNFDKLAQQPEGATLGQVMSSLQSTTETPALSEEEKNALKSVLQKIDNTGKLENQVNDFLSRGQGLAAWNAISQALMGMDPQNRLTIDKNEISALVKALGVSDTGKQQTMSGFGGFNTLSVNSSEFRLLMGGAQNDLTTRLSERQKLEAALDKTLNPLVKKAKDRMDAEAKASALSLRSAEQSKVMIQKTVMTKANEALENAAAGASKDDAALLAEISGKNKAAKETDSLDADLKSGLQNETTGTEKIQSNKNDPLAGAQNNKDAQQAKDFGQSQQGRQDANGKDAKGGKDAKPQIDPLLSKVEVRPSAVNAHFAVPQATASGVQASGDSAKSTAQISRQIASQVEQAMLSASRDGSKRLELQLDPGELGNLTLILTTRNGEVSATIRSERSETADIMNRQLDMIRTNLELQGVKVEKLEVQTQLAGNNGQSQWQGMDQHNARQEEHARQEQLERLRTLGKVRNSSTNLEDATLEQGVQLEWHRAGNAAQSLHLIA